MDGAPHPAPVLIGSRHGDPIPTRPPPHGQEAVTSIQLCLGLGARLVPGIMSQVPLSSHPTAPHALHRLLSLRNLRFPLRVGPSAAPQLTSKGPGVTSSDSSARTRLPGPRRCASSPLWVSASGHVLRAAFPVPLSPLCHLPGITTLLSRWHVHIQSASPLDYPPMRTGRLSRPLHALTEDGGDGARVVVPVLTGRPREEGADLMVLGGRRLLTRSPAASGLRLQRRGQPQPGGGPTQVQAAEVKLKGSRKRLMGMLGPGMKA